MVEIKGSGSNLEMERKRWEGMNDSLQSRLMPSITIKEIKDKEGLVFLLEQENEFIWKEYVGKWEWEVKEIPSELQLKQKPAKKGLREYVLVRTKLQCNQYHSLAVNHLAKFHILPTFPPPSPLSLVCLCVCVCFTCRKSKRKCPLHTIAKALTYQPDIQSCPFIVFGSAHGGTYVYLN